MSSILSFMVWLSPIPEPLSDLFFTINPIFDQLSGQTDTLVAFQRAQIIKIKALKV
jgi:hypothetical protein